MLVRSKREASLWSLAASLCSRSKATFNNEMLMFQKFRWAHTGQSLSASVLLPKMKAFPLSAAAKPPPQDPVAAPPAASKPPLPTLGTQAAVSTEMQPTSQEPEPAVRVAQLDTEMQAPQQELGDKSHLQQQSAEQLQSSPADPERSCQQVMSEL